MYSNICLLQWYQEIPFLVKCYTVHNHSRHICWSLDDNPMFIPSPENLCFVAAIYPIILHYVCHSIHCFPTPPPDSQPQPTYIHIWIVSTVNPMFPIETLSVGYHECFLLPFLVVVTLLSQCQPLSESKFCLPNRQPNTTCLGYLSFLFIKGSFLESHDDDI